MTAKYAYGEKVTITKPGECYGMVGVIVERRAGGMLLAFGYGEMKWLYRVKLDNGKEYRFHENYLQPFKNATVPADSTIGQKVDNVAETRMVRLPFWIIACAAIYSLFFGDGSILLKLQHNWYSPLIFLAVSWFYNGRFGFTRTIQSTRSLSRRSRITLRLVSTVVFLLGIYVELFLWRLPDVAYLPIIVTCLMCSPICLYCSFLGTRD